MGIPDIVTWAESPGGFYLPETKRPIRLADHQKDILRHCFTPGADGKLPYQTVLYSCPKKSGKTTIAALVTLYFALYFEEPNEVYVCANDFEQSKGRVYSDVAESVKLNPVLRDRTKLRAKPARVTLDNGTVIEALPSDYAGSAGSRHGLTVWDELWGYTSESARRLYDELTPIPTRHNSIRLIVSYAGFEGESELLEELWAKGTTGDVIPELAHIENGRGEPACRRAGNLFCYWDHELKEHPGLTMTPDEYHEQQRQDLRENTFKRMHKNEWTSSISLFVSDELWDACRGPMDDLHVLRANAPSPAMWLGADASKSGDHTALVGCYPQGGLVHVVYARQWEPVRGHLRGGKPTVDLVDTIGAEIKRLHRAGYVAGVLYDPWQMHAIAMQFEKAGINMIELPQGNRRTQSDKALHDAIVAKSLRHYGQEPLDDTIGNAVAVENERGLRIAKEKTSKKVDPIVALSMAHFGAITEKPKPKAFIY